MNKLIRYLNKSRRVCKLNNIVKYLLKKYQTIDDLDIREQLLDGIEKINDYTGILLDEIDNENNLNEKPTLTLDNTKYWWNKEYQTGFNNKDIKLKGDK